MSEEKTKEVSSKSAVAEDSSEKNKKIKTSGQMSEMLSIYQDYSEVRWFGHLDLKCECENKVLSFFQRSILESWFQSCVSNFIIWDGLLVPEVGFPSN